MFCFVDHRKLLLTSAKTLHSSDCLRSAKQESLCVSSRNALCSGSSQQREEHFAHFPIPPPSFLQRRHTGAGARTHIGNLRDRSQ